MSRARKTVKVEDVKAKVNKMILDSDDEVRDGRKSLAIFLETVLHDTNNYHGFRYLNKDDMEKSRGTTVGINTGGPIGAEMLTYEERFEGTDDSRVEYF